MKLTAIIERATDGGFAVYSPQVAGVYAPAPTEREAKEEFISMLEESAYDHLERFGTSPEWYSFGIVADVEYTYSLSGFFESFPFINASKFAEAIGINPSLMRRYKSGRGGISKNQKKLIQAKLEEVVENLQAVKL